MILSALPAGAATAGVGLEWLPIASFLVPLVLVVILAVLGMKNK